MNKIKISLFKRAGSPFYHAQYRDPVTGQKVRRSTGERLKHNAGRVAAKWEHEINAGLSWDDGCIPWDVFRDRFESEYLEGLAEKTLKKSISVLNCFEAEIRPRNLKHVNEQTLSKYYKSMREKGRAPATIKGHFAHIRSALSWAKRLKLISRLPQFPQVKRFDKSNVMKGRPITLEEFERMLESTKKVILKPHSKEDATPDESRIPSWQHLLRGLWLSGLRLNEALSLSWDDQSTICVDTSGKRPMMRIPAASEKGNKTRLMPITPDFAEFLLETPRAKRYGFVFNPLPLWATNSKDPDHVAPRLLLNAVSQIISRIGKSAGVIVDTKPPKDKAGEPRIFFASAHDLRRSYGERWAYRVQPKILQELMRHAKIETTMKYYVGLNAEKTADLLWKEFGLAADEKSTLGADLGADADSAASGRGASPR